MIQEWTEKELIARTVAAARTDAAGKPFAARTDAAGKPFAVFVYTPFCGTCQLTERMLEIIMTMEPKLPLYKCNVNFLPQMSRDWQISSVPCIVIVKAGQPYKTIYQMKAVDDLYKFLAPICAR